MTCIMGTMTKRDGGGGGVLRIVGDDRMGAKIKTQKNPWKKIKAQKMPFQICAP